MEITSKSVLLGGISPEQFMRRHWQRKPLLVRGAIPAFAGVLNRTEMFALAARDDVESRLITHGKQGWKMRQGPLPRRALPPLTQREWSLLVQGVDLHSDAAHALLQQFRFIPEVRLDDLMVSYATDGGGVGPHFDSYDVFLLQAHGRRRWRIGRQRDLRLQEGVPLKILADFTPEEEFVLEPGDMLYLPPRYAHDGVAIGECMTCSIGFRAPSRGGIARELLQRVADTSEDELGTQLYRDAGQPAVDTPASIPAALQDFGREALVAMLSDPRAMNCALGEIMTEPKANVWFDASDAEDAPFKAHGLALDRRSRMLYDADHVFINGESYRAGGRDAQLMRRLADLRALSGAEVARASAGARELLQAWCDDGWVHPVTEESA